MHKFLVYTSVSNFQQPQMCVLYSKHIISFKDEFQQIFFTFKSLLF